MWKPVDKSSILKDIKYCEIILSLQPDHWKFWQYIKIQPEKWSEKTMGEQGGGFWVVGIIGKKVIYYKDIEEGYNLSPFTNYGVIDDYLCNQCELHEMIESLYEHIRNCKWPDSFH